MRPAFLLFLASVPLLAQGPSSPPSIQFVAVDPSGACNNGGPMQYNRALNKLWGCEDGTWTLVASGGGASLSFPLTVSGTTTSGGIPYLSSTTALTSSAALASKHVVLGGGAGSAPTSDSAFDDGATTANTLTYTGSGGLALTGGPLAAGSSPPAVTGTGIIGLGESTGQGCAASGAICISAQSGGFLAAFVGSSTINYSVTLGPTAPTANNIPTYTSEGFIGAGITPGTGVAAALAAAVSGTGAICLASGSACSGGGGGSSSSYLPPSGAVNVPLARQPSIAVPSCASSASPAVCGSYAMGSVAIPTGVTSVALVVDTTLVTPYSRIFVFPDDSLGGTLGVTCNSTLATLVGGLAITARTAGTSFTVTYNGTIATNPLCASFIVAN